MGDPAGCGPELTVKAFLDGTIYDKCRPVVIGDSKVFVKMIAILGADIKINSVKSINECLFKPGMIDVYDLDLIDMKSFLPGKVNLACGEAAFLCVKKVIELAMNHEIDATVTNALNKEAMNLAGRHFNGHTEIYAYYTKTDKYTMMLAHGDLRVVHVSTHVALREACDRVKRERVLDVIRIANSACKALGISNPRIGIAGINPHAGENGMFGREEIEEISPAISDAKTEGIAGVDGPIPPDTLFSKALGGWYDIVVAMYHDQGHIPLKVVGFVYDREKHCWKDVSGVNITLGLPIIRASVDHGTAFGHAWQGIQNPISLNNAIDYAITLANNREDR